VGDDVSINSDVLLVIDFVNLKIKPTQSFGCAHRVRCACVHRSEYLYIYEYLYLYCISKKTLQSEMTTVKIQPPKVSGKGVADALVE
jgi:hypothetical protein